MPTALRESRSRIARLEDQVSGQSAGGVRSSDGRFVVDISNERIRRRGPGALVGLAANSLCHRPPTTGATNSIPVSTRTSSPAATPASTADTLVYGMFAGSKAGPGRASTIVHAPV